MKSSGWDHVPHGADIGVRGWGPTPDRAFEQAALALTALVTDPEGVGRDVEVRVACDAPELELLLVDWLNSLVYEMATRRMLFGRFEVEIEGTRLKGRAWGEAVDRERHAPVVEPKGATYTGLSVSRRDEGWLAECVVDV